MTASLTALALEASGVSAGLGGNIGTPLTDFYDSPEKDAYVIEVSSFQAAEVTVSPPVGVLTLLAPDHLDWHGTYDRYVSRQAEPLRAPKRPGAGGQRSLARRR